MARKRWTAQTEITDSLLRLREKRKWQLAYRRYVVEQKPSETYGHYFGLDIATLRKWYELQFSQTISWNNYGKSWQFEHIVPTSFFDFSDESELKLCWNHLNIRVQMVDDTGQPVETFNLLSAKAYFEVLQNKTSIGICGQMLLKLKAIEEESVVIPDKILRFLTEQAEELNQIQSLNNEQLDQLNRGIELKQLLLEREILKKFS